AAASGDRTYTLKYTFVIMSTTASTTQMSPVQVIASGTQNKHTNIDSAYAAILPIDPPTNATSLTKAASPTTLPAAGGTVTYTVTITNNNSPAQAVTLDRFVDTLPSSPASPTFVSGSAMFNGAAISNPSISGSIATFTGPFSVAASSTATLVYKVTYPLKR